MSYCILAPGDFNSTVNELQFSTTTTAIAMSVTLGTDEVFEERELFHVELELLTGGLNVVINPPRASIFITDTNGTICFFTTNHYKI